MSAAKVNVMPARVIPAKVTIAETVATKVTLT
jgi:hypothetical protein